MFAGFGGELLQHSLERGRCRESELGDVRMH
jgi:hypothetical protein